MRLRRGSENSERVRSHDYRCLCRPAAGRLPDASASLAGTQGVRRDRVIMNCNGGVIGSAHAVMAVQTINSGLPLAPSVASGLPRCGEPNVVTTDMGGTTFDVASHRGSASPSVNLDCPPTRVYVETLDVQSVGAGGGSVAWVNEVTGALHVGPRSAGSDPGPACFARGGTAIDRRRCRVRCYQPGELSRRHPAPRCRAAQAAVARLGDLLGLSMLETAAGICQTADAKMADLIRRMTVKRGLDPRGFVVYAYGGAGPFRVARTDASSAQLPRWWGWGLSRLCGLRLAPPLRM